MTTAVESTRPVEINLALEGLVLLVATGLLALSAQIAVTLPFTVVPFTFHVQCVMLLGVLLGARRAGVAVTAYLAEGAMGLPVFAKGGAGLAHLVGPTAGYLFGFIVAAYFVGYFFRQSLSWAAALLVLVSANLLILAMGALWLATFVGLYGAWIYGVAPFLLTACCKLAMLFAVLRPASRAGRALRAWLAS